MDELAKRARAELEPPWDDVREARVLSRVLENASDSGSGSRTRHRVRLAAAVVGLSAAAAVTGLWLHEPARELPSSRSAAASPAPRASVSPPAEAASVLALADGSKAYLTSGAELQTLAQSPALVRLVQTKGEVRYEVKPDSQRPFTIQVRDVEVRVKGTVFTVAAEPDGVRVSVELGSVAVKSGAREVELAPGESLRLSSSEIERDSVQAPRRQPAPEGSTALAPASGTAPDSAAPDSAARLVEEADAARARGDMQTAERALRAVLSRFPKSPQATSAAFTLGRVQRARGDFGAAARTFDGLRRNAPAGPLAEDALAESANAWALAGQSVQASALARQYLARYPRGPHAERMRRLDPQ